MYDFTFADYLEKIGVIDNTHTINKTLIEISLDDFYECYVTYCKDNNLENEDLSHEFFTMTGRKELREIRWVG